MNVSTKAKILWLGIGLVVACDKNPSSQQGLEVEAQPMASDTAPLVLYTVNYPLQYFAQRIGGDLVEAVFPAPEGDDPAYWKPTPEQIVAYQNADLILLNGADYAKWLTLASLPLSKLVDTSASSKDRLIELEAGPVHSHGPEGEHSHKGLAFTTWLDPTLAIEQARTILEALSQARPEHRELFESRFTSLEADLQALDAELADVTSALEGSFVLFSHPVYQYFIRRYGLDAASVHFEPGEVPTGDQWQHLDELLAQRPSRWMIWEDEPLPEIAAKLQERQLEIAVFRPCANVPTTGDYLSVMQDNVRELHRLTK